MSVVLRMNVLTPFDLEIGAVRHKKFDVVWSLSLQFIVVIMLDFVLLILVASQLDAGIDSNSSVQS